jgi:hypothetical protein
MWCDVGRKKGAKRGSKGSSSGQEGTIIINVSMASGASSGPEDVFALFDKVSFRARTFEWPQ